MPKTSEKLADELRCQKCHKLLAKKNRNDFEIKCLRCGQLNFIFEKLNEQVIITDIEGKILYANGLTEEITGYSLPEMIGQKPSLWGGQMTPKFYKAMWQTIKKDKKGLKVMVKNKKKDGTLYNAELQISSILDTKGKIRFFVGVERVKSP